ncbi:MAG: GDYXXLXY domain-containing protein [Eubacteriales bacterium]
MNNLRHNTQVVVISLMIPIIMIVGFMTYEVIAVATGDPVALRVQGYDPIDFLRGHYIRYSILNDMTENIEIADPHNMPKKLIDDDYFYGERGYISLVDTDNDSIYDSYGQFYWKKPNTASIKAKCNYSNYSDCYSFSLDYHQDRYYLNENIAEFVEDEINTSGEFVIVGTTKNGLFRASHIEVNGVFY